jgi:hypothetical protein
LKKLAPSSGVYRQLSFIGGVWTTFVAFFTSLVDDIPINDATKARTIHASLNGSVRLASRIQGAGKILFRGIVAITQEAYLLTIYYQHNNKMSDNPDVQELIRKMELRILTSVEAIDNYKSY